MQPLCGRLLQPGSGALLRVAGLLASSHVFRLGAKHQVDGQSMTKFELTNLPHTSIILHGGFSAFRDEVWSSGFFFAFSLGSSARKICSRAFRLGLEGVGSISAQGSQ